MFWCAKCDRLRDSDDGCAEAPSPPYFPKFGLLCSECMPDEDDPHIRSLREFTPEQQALIDRWEAEADDDES